MWSWIAWRSSWRQVGLSCLRSRTSLSQSQRRTTNWSASRLLCHVTYNRSLSRPVQRLTIDAYHTVHAWILEGGWWGVGDFPSTTYHHAGHYIIYIFIYIIYTCIHTRCVESLVGEAKLSVQCNSNQLIVLITSIAKDLSHCRLCRLCAPSLIRRICKLCWKICIIVWAIGAFYIGQYV